MTANILSATLSLSGLGLFLGVLLAVCAKVFEVHVDPRVTEITEALPGANCGGCGFSGCAAYANAVVGGGAPITACTVAEQSAIDQIAGIMGMESAAAVKQVARVMCAGSTQQALNKYFYDGAHDCVSASRLGGGPKQCTYGCLGYGTCKAVCMFDAIEISDGIAYINEDKCTGCGRCAEMCPKHVIQIMPRSCKVYVACNNMDKGGVVKNMCNVGCIGCKICEKNCEFQAITVNNNLAHIDANKCDNCRKCVEVCPKRVTKIRKVQ